MTTATIQSAVMLPITSTEASFLASKILATYIGDEPGKLDVLVPGGQTFIPVALATDGSAAEFDVFNGDHWEAPLGQVPLARVLLTSTAVAL